MLSGLFHLIFVKIMFTFKKIKSSYKNHKSYGWNGTEIQRTYTLHILYIWVIFFLVICLILDTLYILYIWDIFFQVICLILETLYTLYIWVIFFQVICLIPKKNLRSTTWAGVPEISRKIIICSRLFSTIKKKKILNVLNAWEKQ